jgi:hypothetical protein
MPIFFLFVAVVLIVTGLNGTTSQLSKLVMGDLKGDSKTPSFFAWIIAIFVIGALGYIKAIRPISIAFMVLLILVILLVNNKSTSGGFFINFTKATGLSQ